MVGAGVALCILLACTRRDTEREAVPATPAPASIGFVNKVWRVVESPSGSTGMLYVFLSDGTFVTALRETAPEVGKWSFDGACLTIIEGGLPYNADILALDDSMFHIRCNHARGSFELRFVPAEPSLPVRPVEFDPAEHSISVHGPHWLVTIDGPDAFLRAADEGSLHFAGGWWEAEDAASWWFQARRTFDGKEDTLTVVIRNESCADSSSGAEYPLRGTLVRHGEWMRGCAVAGRPRTTTAPSRE
jgi:uncharacterized membrane protein